ncbi:MAG: DUF1932 domain-containing protein [Actinomycetota bacterium]
MRVGILHPGSMGAALGENASGEVYWASEGRSDTTAGRAGQAAMIELRSLEELVETVDVVISVCPPHAALDVASDIQHLGFSGLYVDANAVAPHTSLEIAEMFDRFVDGGIVGSPPHPPGVEESTKTRLYLSGPEAGTVAGIFADSNLDVRELGDDHGLASALKMAFASWTKGSAALLLTIAAYARSRGVLDDLIHEWEGSIPDLPGRVEVLASGVGRKAWRFEGEMMEAAASLAESGLPDGFHQAATDIYSRLATLKDQPGPESVAEVLTLIERRHR